MNTTNSIEMSAVVKRMEEVISADMGGETVMMSIEQGNYYNLNPIGSRIWDLLEQPVTISQLCDTLMQEFEGDRETCEQDVVEFLNELQEQEIVEIVNA